MRRRDRSGLPRADSEYKARASWYADRLRRAIKALQAVAQKADSALVEPTTAPQLRDSLRQIRAAATDAVAKDDQC